MGCIVATMVVILSGCQNSGIVDWKLGSCRELGISFMTPASWKTRFFDYTLHDAVKPHLEISANFLKNHILFNSQSGKPEIEVDEYGFWIGVFRLEKVTSGTLRAFGANEFVEVDESEENWVLQSPVLGLRIQIAREERVFQHEIEAFLESLSIIP